MKGVLLHIIFILLALCSFGQKPSVQLIVDPDEVGVGQTVTITLKYNMDGQIVEGLPANFIKGYGVNSFSEYIQDVTTGQMIQEHIIVMSGHFTKTGTYKIGPFYVKDGNKAHPSNTVSVRVNNGTVSSTEDFSREQLKKPAFGIIERSSEKIYEGEPLVLAARVYSTFGPTGKPLRKQNYEVSGVVEMYDLLDASNPTAVKIKRKDYITFTYDRKVMFPTGAGFLTIKPFDVFLPYGNNGYSVQSNVPKIEVLPLPAGAPKDFIGAVGSFEIEQKVDAKSLKQGDVFTLDIVISGQGNLHNVEKPRLPLRQGMIIYGDPTLKEEFTYTSAGAVGKITYTYNIQVTKDGDQEVPAVTVSYFDPRKEQYITIDAGSPTPVHVRKNPKYEAPDIADAEPDIINSTDQLAPLSTYKKPVHKSGFFGTPLFWVSLASPLALALLFLFMVKRRDEQAPSRQQEETVKLVRTNSRGYLTEAEANLKAGDVDGFFSNIERALTNLCVAVAKLDESSVYARQELVNGMEAQNVSPEHLQQIHDLFEKCDFARFGSAGSTSDQEMILKNTQSLMKHLIG